MGFIGGEIGYQLLRRISPQPNGARRAADGEAHAAAGDAHGEEGGELEEMFDARVWDELRDKLVIDFGCGLGGAAIEMARRGARKVIGVDIREDVLRAARLAAERAGVADRCEFVTATGERADLIFSLNAFEHFAAPEEVLRQMRRLLKEDGAARIAFGPLWYHPLGGHLFSVFPWAHLVFTERALLRWRSDFKHDGATRFAEVDGGLNRMTIRRFRELIRHSDFQLTDFETVPIKQLRPVANSLTREFTTALVRCRLAPR